MTIDTIVICLLLMVTVPASKKQNSVCSVFFWIKHIVTVKRMEIIRKALHIIQVPFRTEANCATHPS